MNERRGREAVRRLTGEYDEQAADYVDYWAPFLQPMSAEFVTALPDVSPRRILDIGAGAGRTLPVLRDRFPSTLVIGIDRSEGMLAMSEPGEAVAVGDALSLGLCDEAVDLAVMNFMLFHLPDPVAGLREARRVLRPGGTIGVTTWSTDIEAPPVFIWNDALDTSGAAAQDAVKRLAQHELMDTTCKVEQLFADAGFEAVRTELRQFAIEIQLEDFVRLRQTVGSSKARFLSLDEATRSKCLSNVLLRLGQLEPADFVFRVEVIFAVARRPAS